MTRADLVKFAATTAGEAPMRDGQAIIVCGAGVVGASVAYFLARRGAPVTIVDRAGPAAAASGRAGGFLALDWNDGTPLGELARASFTLHHELARELDGERSYGFRPMETLMVAASDDRPMDRYRRLPSPDWLDGNVAVHEVIGSAETTAQVDPARFTGALVDAAVGMGAALVTGVVDGLERDTADGSLRGVAVDGTVHPTSTAVLTLGPWTQRAQAWVALPQVMAMKSASITLAADVPAQAVFSDFVGRDGVRRNPEIYPRPGGVVYVNGYAEHEPLPDDPTVIRPTAIACDALQHMAASHSSVLAGAEVLDRRSCYRPVVPDGLPIIGPVDGAPGLFVATGHASWGILNGPATGRMVAEMILDGASTSVDPTPFTPSRMPAGRL